MKLEKTIAKMAKVLAYVAGGILLGMMALTTADVVMRYIFNSPISGALELGTMMLATIVGLGFAYVQTEDAQISVTILISRLSARGQALARLIYSLSGAFVMSLIVWQFTKHALRSFREHAVEGLIEIPLGPMHSIFAFGCAVLVLALIVNSISSVRSLMHPIHNNNERRV